MQMRWLTQIGSSKVIVVFGGWALGAGPLAHLTGAQDVLFIDDYRSLDALPDLGDYAHKTAIAFSFGVAAFSHLSAAELDVFDEKIAINGSYAPVDRRLGIPPRVFDKTHDSLSTDRFQDFLALCYGAPQSLMEIDVVARRAELAAVKAREPGKTVGFDRIWISTADRIFPPANLQRAWSDQSAVTKTIDAPHVPFAQWKTWDEVTS